MGLNFIRKLFKRGNVCVTGLRGTGKDMLCANVAVRDRKQYVSNIDYTHDDRYLKLDLKKLDCGGNTYKNFITGDIIPFVYEYPEGADIYISDVGVYFPSQYCNELNRDCKSLPVFMALSRQIADNNIHINVQNLNRAWDKLREQSDTYIYCRWCKVLFGIVLQKVTIYEKYESCLNRMEVPRVRVPLFNAQAKASARIYLDQFRNTHGKIVNKILIYKNRSKYDTRIFKRIIGGEKI